jgi:hypothetical protein
LADDKGTNEYPLWSLDVECTSFTVEDEPVNTEEEQEMTKEYYLKTIVYLLLLIAKFLDPAAIRYCSFIPTHHFFLLLYPSILIHISSMK